MPGRTFVEDGAPASNRCKEVFYRMIRGGASVDGVGAVVRGLRVRQGEIEEAIFAGVCEAVPESASDVDSEYVNGLRGAVAAAVEFGFAGIERGEDLAEEIPREAVAQARLAARSGVSMEAVLRRYIVGHALLWDYVMEEADRVERTGQASGLREIARAQASLLDQLVIGVTREHVAELQRAGRSREHRQLERVRILLAGEHSDAGMVARGVDPELDYDFEGEHLGVIGRGAGARQALGEMAERLDRRLLCVAQGTETEWAWLGGRRPLDMADLVRGLSAVTDHPGQIGEYAEAHGTYLSFAVGEPAKGLDGWRLTHQQAQAALAVALRRPQRLTRYADVALLATALKDEMLARALIDTYLAPLDDHRGGGTVLRETLRAYLAAEQNISSAAASLGVVWNTVKNRLQTIETMLGRTLHPCPAELEVALQLDELGVSTAVPEASNTG
jgi:hypothetical protein